ncbi:hypothetical protein ACTA71_009303 [Dictyostelium dimigraforme]
MLISLIMPLRPISSNSNKSGSSSISSGSISSGSISSNSISSNSICSNSPGLSGSTSSSIKVHLVQDHLIQDHLVISFTIITDSENRISVNPSGSRYIRTSVWCSNNYLDIGSTSSDSQMICCIKKIGSSSGGTGNIRNLGATLSSSLGNQFYNYHVDIGNRISVNPSGRYGIILFN